VLIARAMPTFTARVLLATSAEDVVSKRDE